MRCVHCGKALSGGRDTYGSYGKELCAHCWYKFTDNPDSVFPTQGRLNLGGYVQRAFDDMEETHESK